MKVALSVGVALALSTQNGLGQSLITTLDRNLSAVPIVYSADVAPGGILGYNERTKEVFYEGRSAIAKTLPLAPDATFPFPHETVTKSRGVDVGLAFFGVSISAGFKVTGTLDIAGGEFTVHRFIPDPDAPGKKPFDALVFTDKETIDTAYDGYMKWKNWNALLIEAVYKTKSLTITKSSSVGVKLSNGDTPPDCVAPAADPKQKDSSGGSEIKKTGTTKDAGSSSTDPKVAAQIALQVNTKQDKPDTAAKTTEKAAAAVATPKVSIQACFNTNRELVFSSDQPAVSAIKLLELFPDPAEPLGFNYRTTTATF